MTNLQKIVVGILIALALVLGVVAFTHKTSTLGDATVQNFPEWFYGGIVIGPSNSQIGNIVTGTCNLTGATSVADRASETLTCAMPKNIATTLKVGDIVYATSSNGGTDGAGAFPIIGAEVTDTSTVTITEQNQTGGTTTPSGGAITGIGYYIVRPVTP